MAITEIPFGKVKLWDFASQMKDLGRLTDIIDGLTPKPSNFL